MLRHYLCAAITVAAGLVFTSLAEAVPVNDRIHNAIALPAGDGFVLGSTIDATLDSPAGTNDTSGISLLNTTITAPGVWYATLGTGNTIVLNTFSTNTTYDTKLHVFSGDIGSLVGVRGNDDFPGGPSGFMSRVSFSSVADTQYWVLVSGFSSNTGDFQLNFTGSGSAPTPSTTPTIAANPEPATAALTLLAVAGSITWTLRRRA